ncbi:MAG: DNA cytosine methyltransferase [Planctomycetales bacterium]|nr:DNA cytosine methyltransferase [Planctomycetales bacterium]
MTDEPTTCLDLFCGCGGFSLGLHRARPDEDDE